MLDRFLRPMLAAAVALGLCTGLQAQTTAPVNGPYYATPSWDQKLPSATRFVLLANWGGQAVLDRETGLVWMRSLLDTHAFYPEAAWACMESATGDRGGWRLPTMTELLRTVVVGGGVPISDSPFDFINAGPPVTLWSSTPQTLVTADIPGRYAPVDWIRVLTLTPGRYRIGGMDRISTQFRAAVWCVQSPGATQ